MDIELLRNVGIVAHIDAGKTTTTERILYYSGKNYRIGEVDAGAATMDWMPQEQERGITITAAATTCYWQKNNQKHQINIIDTPGHVDFTIEVERSLRVMDGVIVVVCAVAGLQPQTETVWRQADKFNVPRMVLVNKLDRKGANFDNVLKEISDSFDCQAVSITIPFGSEEDLKGVIDLLSKKLYLFSEQGYGKEFEVVDIPADYEQEVEKKRQQLFEAASSYDDNILEQLLENEIPASKDVIIAIKKGCLARKLIPVFAGSAFKNKGIQNLIDGIIDFLPNPLEVEKVHAKKGEQDIQIECNPKARPLALIFKVQIDPYAGMLSYLRVYSGELKVSKGYWNESRGKHERLMKLFRVHSAKKELIDSISAGDIAAAAGLNNSQTGDTLGEKDNPTLLETIFVPQPVIEVAIELKSGSDAKQLEDYLFRLVREDPSLNYRKDSETGQSILSGMGELHLEVALDRIRREGKVGVNIGNPRVAKRETATKNAKATEVFDKPLMGKPSYAKVAVELEPYAEEANNKIEINADSKGLAELPELLKATCDEALHSGVIAGNPVIKTKVKVVDIEVDSNSFQPAAFKIALSTAIRRCLLAADCKTLSPYMKLETKVPAEFLGGTINDLNQRNAKINLVQDNEAEKIIMGFAPLENLIGYMTKLRSLTKGKGVFTMEFDHFE